MFLFYKNLTFTLFKTYSGFKHFCSPEAMGFFSCKILNIRQRLRWTPSIILVYFQPQLHSTSQVQLRFKSIISIFRYFKINLTKLNMIVKCNERNMMLILIFKRFSHSLLESIDRLICVIASVLFFKDIKIFENRTNQK